MNSKDIATGVYYQLFFALSLVGILHKLSQHSFIMAKAYVCVDYLFLFLFISETFEVNKTVGLE